MDLLNRLPATRFRTIDDLLAFISIYDDRRRTRAYLRLLRSNKNHISGAVCLEGGCGLGLFSIEMARLGAKKVYAVEQNPVLAQLAKSNFGRLPKNISKRIELLRSPLQKFRPPERIHVLLHEFYGQLLYDEDLWVLDRLHFKPDLVLPNGGELLAGVVSSRSYVDEVVTSEVVRQLDGALVSGLFEEKLSELRLPVLRWNYGRGLSDVRHNFKKKRGDLVCFGLVVTHNGRPVCEAGRCPNWSYVWSSRKGNKVAFRFRRSGPSMDCTFRWVS